MLNMFRARDIITAIVLAAGTASAGPISIGFLSLDLSSPISGQNTISLNNFTGLSLGCGAVDPSLPVCTPETITGVLVTRVQLGNNPIVTYTDILTADPAGTTALRTYADTFNLLSAVLTGTISTGSLTLPGNVHTTVNPAILADTLTQTQTIALLNVNQLTGVPEPATGALAAAAFAGMAFVIQRRASK
jgi:hypothetical protein